MITLNTDAPHLCTGHIRPSRERRVPCLGQLGGTTTGLPAPRVAVGPHPPPSGPEGAEPSALCRAKQTYRKNRLSERPSVNVPSVLALPVRSGFEGCQRRSCRSYSSGADKHHKYARFEQVLKSTDIIPIFLSALTRAPPPFFSFCGELSSAVGDGSEVFL